MHSSIGHAKVKCETCEFIGSSVSELFSHFPCSNRVNRVEASHVRSGVYRPSVNGLKSRRLEWLNHYRIPETSRKIRENRREIAGSSAEYYLSGDHNLYPPTRSSHYHRTTPSPDSQSIGLELDDDDDLPLPLVELNKIINHTPNLIGHNSKTRAFDAPSTSTYQHDDRHQDDRSSSVQTYTVNNYVTLVSPLTREMAIVLIDDVLDKIEQKLNKFPRDIKTKLMHDFINKVENAA